MRKVIILVFCILGFIKLNAQITITPNQTANILAQSLVGSGVTISNPTLNCSANGNGVFVVTPPNVTNLGLTDGILLTSGDASIAAGIAGSPSASTSNGGDPDLALLAGQTSNDKCILEFDFIPLGDSIKFDYVFASSEYQSFTCSSFNDVFGFFISGPAITGPFSNNAKNIALVPGTNCPVGVNTINGSTSNPCGNVTSPCAPPNNVLFTNNIGGTTVAYNGFTHVLTALSAVTPCVSHHLKLAISDATDQILDSGVWLKAGSLSSNSIVFTPISNLLAPYPYIVEGCAPGYVKVKRPIASPLPYTVNYQLGGTASAADYTVSTIPLPAPGPGQITIPANDTVAYISFFPLQDGIVEPLEEIKIYQLAPCTNNIVDSTSLFISDTIQMNIITPDTAICAEDSVHILVNGSDSLIYTWSPITNINNSIIKEPTVSPNATTNYVVCATLPNSGCAPKCDTIKIIINQPPVVHISNDTIICKDMVVQFNPTISPNQTYTYSWAGTGSAYLNATNILNPVGTFSLLGTYNLVLNVDPTAVGCQGTDTITVQVIPNDITLLNNDTIVCKGATLPINVNGHPLFSYNWTPSTYLNNPTIEDPISNPDTSVTYTVVATFPGCLPMTKSFSIDVQPVPIINAGIDRSMCQFDTVQLHATVVPSSYPFYSYSWTPATYLNNNTIPNPYFEGLQNELLQLIVSTPIGCADTDQVVMTVNPIEFANVIPEEITICPHDTVFYNAGGGVAYHWTPSYGLNDTTISNPYAVVYSPTEYTLYTLSPQGCVDTDLVRIDVGSAAVLNLGDDITLYPTESANLYADGNCSFFNWFPNYHLSSNLVKDPIANPPVTTQYFVTGTTENGCKITDSITIRISPESVLDLPNAFSPGSGTSINDDLKIIKRGDAKLNYFRIFNRWGEQVFETKEIEKGWNGQYKGTVQPMGVYVYVIEAVTSTGKRFYKQGNVTLIR